MNKIQIVAKHSSLTKFKLRMANLFSKIGFAVVAANDNRNSYRNKSGSSFFQVLVEPSPPTSQSVVVENS
jgi:hypothetical protein